MISVNFFPGPMQPIVASAARSTITTASLRVLRSRALPGIRFAEVRARERMAQVLGPVDFVPCGGAKGRRQRARG